jgi:hypothetical protein
MDRDRPSPVWRALQTGAWALPVFGALLTLATLTHQPDPTSDFSSYADYVTTTPFLVSHLVASIGGAAFGIIGLACVAVLLAARSARPRRTLIGAGLSIVANVVNTSLYGVAAFAQPAIGRLADDDIMVAQRVNEDVYGVPLIATAVVALLLWTAGAVLLGGSVRRHDTSLRAVGIVWQVTLPVFYVAGLAGSILQPLAGAAFTVATVVLVRRLPALAPDPASASTLSEVTTDRHGL